MTEFKSLKKCIAFLVLAVCGMAASVSANDGLLNLEEVVPEEILRADAKAFRSGYHELHPAPFHNVSAEKLEAAFDHIENSIQGPMTILEAWRLFSTINPVMGDAHAGVIIPQRSKIIDARLREGERLFPLSVYFKQGNRLFAKFDDEAAGGVKKDAEILAINGQKTAELIPEMLRHMRGDTLDHRRVLLERWFAAEYWSLFGSSKSFRVQYREDGKVKETNLNGRGSIPQPTSAKPFKELFEYKTLDANTGYIRIDTFDRKHMTEFLAMTETAFRSFKAGNVRRLIIDIRENGGGGNSMWQKGVMPYIADKPYRHVSSYKARVTANNASEGDVIGEVQSGTYNVMTPPELDNPLRFKGKIYLFIGNMTYSSAIHFAITLQDYGIATLVGQQSGGRAGTTGNITYIKLPGTRLRAFAPVMLFSRPIGDGNESPVQPDLIINHYPDNPAKDIDDLMQQIGN